AFLLKNAQGKDASARSFVDELRADYKPLGESTGCLIYNATGDRLQLVAYNDFSGRLARSPYPIFIENGQWGVFLHGRFGAVASTGAVVYEGYNVEGHKC
ncbi:hypothetical protein P5E90_16505, partial [Clostridium perfringens]|nr:hypothetical protein [Clostridium perfringens]